MYADVRLRIPTTPINDRPHRRRTTEFNFTGHVQTFNYSLPSTATSLYLLCCGGDGGNAVNGYKAARGGCASGTLELNPGIAAGKGKGKGNVDVFTLVVAVGGVGGNTDFGHAAAGGWNGGGSASNMAGGSGGGGGTDVRLLSTHALTSEKGGDSSARNTGLSSRIIVGGGGGGSPGNGLSGGAGGGVDGQRACPSQYVTVASQARGGNQTHGGHPGGAVGQGGECGSASFCAGGGGGWQGGGSGALGTLRPQLAASTA